MIVYDLSLIHCLQSFRICRSPFLIRRILVLLICIINVFYLIPVFSFTNLAD